MVDTSEILGILDAAAERRTTALWGQSGETNMYKEHVRRAAEVIRALEREVQHGNGRKQCDRAPWCAYDRGHEGQCSLIRPRTFSLDSLTLGEIDDALSDADEYIDAVHEEGPAPRRRGVQVGIDRAREMIAKARGMDYVRFYDDNGRPLHEEDDDA